MKVLKKFSGSTLTITWILINMSVSYAKTVCRCSLRCSEKICNIHWKTPLKDTPTQVFSCEYCEIFFKRLFYRTPPVAASSKRQAR